MKSFTRSLALSFTALALLGFASAPALAADDPEWPVVSATDASKLADHVGKEVVVEGVVKRAGRGPSDGVRFLNFDEATRTGFVAAIFPSAYSGIDPVEDYVGRTVRVSGELETYKERVQIKVSNAAQILVVSGQAGDAVPATE
jgi:DNA/RNA endonuclease YhcR with UshA esterase domain